MGVASGRFVRVGFVRGEGAEGLGRIGRECVRGAADTPAAPDPAARCLVRWILEGWRGRPQRMTNQSINFEGDGVQYLNPCPALSYKALK